jgi:hypothetical protein
MYPPGAGFCHPCSVQPAPNMSKLSTKTRRSLINFFLSEIRSVNPALKYDAARRSVARSRQGEK